MNSVSQLTSSILTGVLVININKGFRKLESGTKQILMEGGGRIVLVSSVYLHIDNHIKLS